MGGSTEVISEAKGNRLLSFFFSLVEKEIKSYTDEPQKPPTTVTTQLLHYRPLSKFKAFCKNTFFAKKILLKSEVFRPPYTN